MQRLYEAMFIVDSNKARENYEKYEDEVKGVITRSGGNVVGCAKWDDRRLAYEMNKVKRGTYILVHFEAEGDVPAKVERFVRINEQIIRVLVTVDQDGIETDTGSARERAEAATVGDSDEE